MGRAYTFNQGGAQAFRGSEGIDGTEPPTLTASVNNYDPPDGRVVSLIVLRASTPLNITGLAGSFPNRILRLMNASGNEITLVDTSGLSIAANQFLFGSNAALLADGGIVDLQGGLAGGWLIASSSAGGGGGGAPTTSIFLTGADESATLPNSLQLLAGAGIAFDDAVANERTISNIAVPQIEIGANFDIANVSDVLIVGLTVPGVVAGDQIYLDAWFLILNDAGANRTYTITPDFNITFDNEFATNAVVASATGRTPYHVRGCLNVRANNLALACFHVDQVNTASDSGANVTMANGVISGGILWGTTTNDLTGDVGVTVVVRSSSATGTQTLFLLGARVWKEPS